MTTVTMWPPGFTVSVPDTGGGVVVVAPLDGAGELGDGRWLGVGLWLGAGLPGPATTTAAAAP